MYCTSKLHHASISINLTAKSCACCRFVFLKKCQFCAWAIRSNNLKLTVLLWSALMIRIISFDEITLIKMYMLKTFYVQNTNINFSFTLPSLRFFSLCAFPLFLCFSLFFHVFLNSFLNIFAVWFPRVSIFLLVW